MRKNALKFIFTTFLVLSTQGKAWSLNVKIEEKINTIYSDILTKVRSGEIAQQEHVELSGKLKISEYEKNYGGKRKVYIVRGTISLVLNAETLQIEGIANTALRNKLKEENSQEVPTSSVVEAVKKARGYLAQIGVQLPRDCYLTAVRFNSMEPSGWEVRWERFIDGYPYEMIGMPDKDGVSISFHEKLGLISFSYANVLPTPKGTEVKLDRSEALMRASQYAPLVFRTPFYSQARAKGFEIKGAVDASLKVVTPNWLLNPEKAIWISESSPEETRLCWVIRFTTVDAKAEERGMKDKDGKTLKLIPPDILIYLDAATGECVGANFT